MSQDQFLSMKEFAQNFIKMMGWYEDSDVHGVFIVGSVSAGCNDSRSDLDIVVLVDVPASDEVRLSKYQFMGCQRAMVGFFQKDASQLNSNVAVIDKIWLNKLQIDISYCTENEIAVYNHQPIIILKSSAKIEDLQPATRMEDIAPNLLEDRLKYDFRILEVHRDRYERWCTRGRWLSVDLSKLLFAVRDIVLVLNGYWEYNAANSYFWNLLGNMNDSVPGLLKTLEDIKELDDRSGFKMKLSLIDSLAADLKQLCLSRKILVQLYDIDNPYSN